MRSARAFTFRQWLVGQPLKDGLKQIRNDLLLNWFCKKRPVEYLRVLENLRPEFYGGATKDLIVSIAFEKPAVVALQVSNFQKYAVNSKLVVADNSRTEESRVAIKNICDRANVAYIPLPRNSTRHANRSHGMAMQWCYINIVLPLKPSCFAFVDHDLIPMRQFSLSRYISAQPFYGVLWRNKVDTAWQLWAGYSVFDFSVVEKLPLNFLYDFSNGLDTGGRNYFPLYCKYDRGELNFASNMQVDIPGDEGMSIQVIDDCWLHMGGAGHRRGFGERFEAFGKIVEWIELHPDWSCKNNTFLNVRNIRH